VAPKIVQRRGTKRLVVIARKGQVLGQATLTLIAQLMEYLDACL